MVSAANLEEVLEVVIPHITNLCTLCVCSRLSTRFEAATRSTVQLRLPALLESAPSDDRMLSEYAHGKGPLPWLCRVAGPDRVSTLEAGCAILRKACEQHVDHYVASLIISSSASQGLRLTNEMLVCMAKQRTPRLGFTIRKWREIEPCHVGDNSQLDQIYLDAATWGAMHDRRYDRTEFEALLPLVTAANLPDVLLLLVNAAASGDGHAADAFEWLLQHDKEKLHVLHTPASSGDSKEGGSSTSGQPRDQQWQAEFVTHLLETCVLFDMFIVFAAVADLPAAQSLSATAVTRLLYFAWLQMDARGMYTSPSSAVVESITSLPGAKGVSADCISTLVLLSFDPKQARRVGISELSPLLQLPSAKHINSHELCRLIYKAGRYGMRSLLTALCRLAEDRQLDSDAVVWLIKRCIDKSWPGNNQGMGDLEYQMHLLRPLQLGCHLSGDNLLTVMEYCVASENSLPEVIYLSSLRPAADQIDNVQRLIAVIERVVQGNGVCDGGYLASVVGDLLSDLPVAQLMQLSDWVAVISNTLKELGAIPEGCEKLPVVQGMDVDTLGQLLQLAVAAEDGVGHGAAAMLCSLPAAKQLPLSLITEVVLQMLPKTEHDSAEGGSDDSDGDCSFLNGTPWGDAHRAVSNILKLGLLQQLPAEALHQLLDTLVDRSLLAAAQEIHAKCPQPEQWQPQLSMERWVEVLQRAWGRADVVTVFKMVEKPQAQDLTPQQVESLLVLCLQRGNAAGLDFCSHLVALPGSQQLDSAALMRLLASAEMLTKHRQGFVAMLLRLPAAGSLDASALAPLVMSCLQSAEEDNYSIDLLSLPVVRSCFDANRVAELLQEAVTKGDASRVSVLLALPAMQQLSVQQLRSLVLLAVCCGDVGLREQFMKLPVVQTAAAKDAELQALCGAVQQLKGIE